MRIEIHTSGLTLSAEQREHIHRRASFTLSRLASRIARVEVGVHDINGPRGGIDKRCCVRVHLDRGPAVVVERLDRDLLPLVDRCFASLGRAVNKRLETESAQRFLPRQVTQAALSAKATSAEMRP